MLEFKSSYSPILQSKNIFNPYEPPVIPLSPNLLSRCKTGACQIICSRLGLDVRYQRADAATSDINAGLYLQHMLADGMWFVHVSPFTLQENNGERGLLARMRRYLATRRRNLCQMPGDVARIKARVYF